MSGPVHWLYRPRTRRLLAIAGGVMLALALAAELLVHLHPAFGFDAWFGFNAAYGLATCVGMVLFARLLGLLVKRPWHYYERRRRIDTDAGDAVDDPQPRREGR